MRTLRSLLLLSAGTLALSTAAAQDAGTGIDTIEPDSRENRRMIRQAEVQTTGENTWTFGPKIGVNASAFSNMSADHRLGPSAGVFFVYSHREHLGITGDLLYSYKGGEREFTNDNIMTKYSTQLSYIELPVQAVYFFRPGTKFRPKIGVGPYAAVLVDAEQQVKTEIDRDGPDAGNETETNAENYSAFDWGLTGTAGFNYQLMDDTWVNVDMRYGHGFSNVNDESRAQDVKNRSWALQVGLGFPLNRK